MSDNFGEVINSKIWAEQAEPDNPFSAATCRCYGYDVYGDLLGKASFIEYLYLLFRGERPTPEQGAALEVLAVAIANPGPRDPSVHAAMASSVAGAPAASVLMATLAVGAGSYCGGREVFLAMQNWIDCGNDLAKWQARLAILPEKSYGSIWPTYEHHPGFDPYGVSCATPVRQTLAKLCTVFSGGNLSWLAQNREALESVSGIPLAMAGVTAAALIDLGFSVAEGEMLSLLLRLPGAAAHGLEQWQRGFRQFPFFELDLLNDPGSAKEQV
jgi:citrate synthase